MLDHQTNSNIQFMLFYPQFYFQICAALTRVNGVTSFVFINVSPWCADARSLYTLQILFYLLIVDDLIKFPSQDR